MKKLVSALIAAVMLILLCACGKTPADPGTPETSPLEEGETPGVLLYTPFAMRYEGINALALSGDKAGSEALNSMPPAKEGIRCVFELGEEISFTLAAEGVEGEVTAALVPHMAFKDYKHYDINSAGAVVTAPAAPETRGALRLDASSSAPGYYDLVFSVDGKLVAMCYVRLVLEGSLSGLTDKEIAALAG